MLAPFPLILQFGVNSGGETGGGTGRFALTQAASCLCGDPPGFPSFEHKYFCAHDHTVAAWVHEEGRNPLLVA
jgi:hypothetical protein